MPNVEKNPLYTNEFYFFSGMYDDSLITDFYRKISAETYERSIQTQHNMIGRTRCMQHNAIYYKATMGEFVVDDKYNSNVGIPLGSRTLKFDHMVIPYHNKKRYMKTYGVKNRKIPLEDFFKRTDIFNKVMILQLGRFRLMKAYLIENVDLSVTLAIPNSNTDGIISTGFDNILADYTSDEPVWIFTDEITQAYTLQTTAAASISSTATGGFYEVTINKSTAMNTVGEPRGHTFANSWDCLMTVNSSRYGPRTLVTYPCTLKSSTNTTLTFSVPEKFINYIKSSATSFNLGFFNRHNRKHIYTYTQSSNTDPVICLDYIDNPAGNINIEVFELDTANCCKGRKLYDPDFVQTYFPNIFDFSPLNVNNADLIVEITEYDPTYTNYAMNNSLTPLIESTGLDFYTEMVQNGYDTLNGESVGLSTYHPKNFPITYEDYTLSPYYGDIRGYMLDKIVQTIKTDPHLLVDYYKWIDAKHRKIVTLSGTPKKLRFGTGGSGEFTGLNRIVTDTSIASKHPDDIQYFTEPHSYIQYRNSDRKSPGAFFVDGKYVRPTAHRFYKGFNYAFYPVSVVTSATKRFNTAADLIAASPLTFTFFPDSYYSMSDAPKDAFTINSKDDEIKLFSHLESPVFALKDLVMYDTNTGEFINEWWNHFKVQLDVTQFQIDTPGGTETVIASRGDGANYLLTSLNEIYCTMDTEPIILGSSTITLDWSSYIESLIKQGEIIDPFQMMGKDMNFNDITLIPTDDYYIGKSISVYTNKFRSEYIVSGADCTYVDDHWEVTLENALVDPDLELDHLHYMVFKNGQLAHYDLVNENNIYNGSLKVIIYDTVASSDVIDLVHFPIGYTNLEWEYKVNDEFNSVLYYTKAPDTTGTTIETIWPEEDEPLVNGMVFNTYSEDFLLYPVASPNVLRFSRNGYLMPPPSKDINLLNGAYYAPDRCSQMAEASTPLLKYPLFIQPCDLGIMSITEAPQILDWWKPVTVDSN